MTDAAEPIAGGLAVPWIGRLARRRTYLLIAAAVATAVSLILIGVIQRFVAAVALLVVWAMAFAATLPVRQAYLNAQIPTRERATVLSFDNMLTSAGGSAFQPALGRVADVWGYAISYIVTGAIACVSLPFLWLARRTNVSQDVIRGTLSAKDSVPER